MCKCFFGMCFFRLPEICVKIYYIYKFKYHHSTMKCRDIYNIFQHQYHGIATAKRSIKNGEIWSYIYISTGTFFFYIFFLCCWCLFMFNQTFICKYLFPLSPWNIVQFSFTHLVISVKENSGYKMWNSCYKLHFLFALSEYFMSFLIIMQKENRKHVNHFLK